MPSGKPTHFTAQDRMPGTGLSKPLATGPTHLSRLALAGTGILPIDLSRSNKKSENSSPLLEAARIKRLIGSGDRALQQPARHSFVGKPAHWGKRDLRRSRHNRSLR